jgi:hypothetical protein
VAFSFCGGEEMFGWLKRKADTATVSDDIQRLNEGIYPGRLFWTRLHSVRDKKHRPITFSGTVSDFREYLAGWR